MSNDGNIRFFLIIGEILGYIIYYFIMGNIILTIFQKTILFINKLILVIYKMFLRPILKVIFKIYRVLLKITSKIKINNILYKKNKDFSLKKNNIMLYNLIRNKK